MNNEAPSFFSLTQGTPAENVAELGEVTCGVVLTPDGSFRVFASGIDATALAGDDLTVEQEAQLEMGRKLTALTLALSNDQVMAVLLDLAGNPDLDLESLTDVPVH
jgi:hypothetical protein